MKRREVSRTVVNDRKQAVVVNGSRSAFVPLESGVLQGSVLGLSLFFT